MSLLDEAMEACVMMDKRTVDDGYGGFINEWVEGANFVAAADLNSSIQARVAEVQGVQGIYRITTPRNVNLQDRDVFKRLSDGKFFRVTSDGDDVATPQSAQLDMRQVDAEELKTLPI